MQIRTGIDLLKISKLKKSIERSGKIFLNKIFTQNELNNNPTVENLAGVFSAKEAVIKALDLNTDHWHNIEISKGKNGKPEFRVIGISDKIICSDLSISHTDDDVVASVVILTE